LSNLKSCLAFLKSAYRYISASVCNSTGASIAQKLLERVIVSDIRKLAGDIEAYVKTSKPTFPK